jgi:activator of 2-hydroxyglutaryl-CoA dehydratase
LSFFGNAETVEQLQAGVTPEKIVAGWTPSLSAFEQVRRKYFLYK